MNHDELIRQVQHRAALPYNEAEVVFNAVKETLAEWLLGESADTLAEWVLKKEPADLTQLPQGIADYLEYARSPIGELSIDEFFERVSQRAKINLSDAIYRSCVVLNILQEAISQDEIDDIPSQLPKDFLTLFEAVNKGKMEVNS